LTRVVSISDARRLGEQLLQTCKQVRVLDKQKGRTDDEMTAWLSAQVECFALYIKTLSHEAGRSGKEEPLVDQMIEECRAITRYVLARALHPEGPRESLNV
jgi:hypothetical protein